ncbi:hypothetical protein, partial [Bacillus altitudinis]|uniref:hypothetical protein n=1 Tax=Bacillus altitudinis TaxID=293387 RepID=UPI002F921D6B
PAEAVRAAGRALVDGADGEVNAWLDEHRRWWADFWSRSYLALESATGEAEYEERVWYTNLYYLACAHGGAYPARFNGGPFLLDRDCRDW